MRKVEYESGPFGVSGYAALPSLTEGSRAHQTISVNGRFVRAENLHRGLDDAYRATVPSGRYPPVAVEITADPRRVDVNVHPTKQVVRFSEERAARDAVAAAVRDRHRVAPPGPALDPARTRKDLHPGPLLRALASAGGLPLPRRRGPHPRTTRRRRGVCGRRANASRRPPGRSRNRWPRSASRTESCRSGAGCRRPPRRTCGS